MPERTRFNRYHPCPVCGGGKDSPQHSGQRCWGYQYGQSVYCTREEFGGEWDEDKGAYRHAMVVREDPVETRFAVYHGEQLYHHIRLDYPDGHKDFRWEPLGLDPRKVLYGTELLNGQKAAYLTEGEKAADALRAVTQMPVLATVCGAHGVPDMEALKGLAGKDVYTWPDGSEKGILHMRQTGEVLAEIGATPYMIQWQTEDDLDLDAYDWVDWGGTRDQLRQLCLEARERGDPEAWSSIVPKPVEWLWRPYVPIGAVTMVEGDPGVGKSFVSVALSAAVTNGMEIDGQQIPQGTVVFQSAEDDLATTLVPRAVSLGADVSKIFTNRQTFTLDDDGFKILESMIRRHHPKLVVIDPLFAHMGDKVDIYRANHVRRVTARLKEIAQRENCAILCIRHLTKSKEGSPINRGAGSIDLSAAVRSVLLVGAHKENQAERAVIQIKNNLGAWGHPQGYTLGDGQFRWTGYSTMIPADLA